MRGGLGGHGLSSLSKAADTTSRGILIEQNKNIVVLIWYCNVTTEVGRGAGVVFSTRLPVHQRMNANGNWH
jgi:hypothetical protein